MNNAQMTQVQKLREAKLNLQKTGALGTMLAMDGLTNLATNAIMRKKFAQRLAGRVAMHPIAEGYRGNVRSNPIINFGRGILTGMSRDAADGINIARGVGSAMKMFRIDPSKISPRTLVGIRHLANGDLVRGTNILKRTNPHLLSILRYQLKNAYGEGHMSTQLIDGVNSMGGGIRNAMSINTAYQKTALPNVISGMLEEGRKNKTLWKNYSDIPATSTIDKMKRKLIPEVPLDTATKMETLGRLSAVPINAIKGGLGDLYSAGRQGIGELARATKGSTSAIGRFAHKTFSNMGEFTNIPDTVIGSMGENAYARGLARISEPKADLARKILYTPLQGANSFVQDQAYKIGNLHSHISGVDSTLYNQLKNEKLGDLGKRVKKDGGYIADL